jgi:hypothetical protein
MTVWSYDSIATKDGAMIFFLHMITMKQTCGSASDIILSTGIDQFWLFRFYLYYYHSLKVIIRNNIQARVVKSLLLIAQVELNKRQQKLL